MAQRNGGRVASKALALSLCVLGPRALAAPAAEEVLSLPGYGKPPSRQWSGFLDASKEEPGTFIHYWFAEAEAPGAADLPVVLWLNGGPGATSVAGFLMENGPLLTNATGGLMQNPYAWTKQANLLAIESPGGVGYSYCAAMTTGGFCNNTDKSTAKVNRAALQDFFATKFPELRANRFYITGESYAGVYIPTLSAEILDSAPEIQLTGIAVGDPCTDNDSQMDSMDMIWYAHKNGFLPDEDFNFLWYNCSERHPSFLHQGRLKRESGRWAKAAQAPRRSLGDPKLDALCTAANRRFIAASSQAFSQDWPLAWINDLTLYGPGGNLDFVTPGTLGFMTATWMMRDDVRQALHMESAPAKTWPGPADQWQYNKQYAACNSPVAPGTPSMIDFYRNITPRLKRTIVFNGDTDPCVSYEGTRIAIKRVGLAELEGGQYRPWFYDQVAASLSTLMEKPDLFGPDLSLQNNGAQLGGMVVDYEQNLSFVTVHGSGHMVPQFRPQAAAMLLQKLLSGEPFAQKFLSNEELGKMSDDDFSKALDAWTKQAEAGAVPTKAAQAPSSMVVV